VKSTLCSQSTPIVAPRDAMFMPFALSFGVSGPSVQ
jgi:hypothetical protein